MINWLKPRPGIDAKNIVGNAVFGDVHGNLTQQFFESNAPPNEPTLPWRSLPTEFDAFRFLSWRTRLVLPLVGREFELKSLTAWAEESGEVKVRFLTGAGGTGKSRLAAELAAKLREKNWSAGFVALDKPAILPLPKEGLLWIADYPEENRAATQELLGALARVEKQSTAIRLLLLSRRGLGWWQGDVDRAHAAEICDTQATTVASLSEGDTVTLYRLTYERVTEHLQLRRSETRETTIRSWWRKQPAFHGIPLFAMAAAMHSAVEETQIPTLQGGEVVQALVRRERLRIDNVGHDMGFANSGLSRIIGLAAIPGRLPPDDLRQFANPELEIGTPTADRIVDSLNTTPWWEDHSLPGLGPDLLAAELLLQILSDRPDRAVLWLSVAILRSSPTWISRIERLAYDIKRTRGAQEGRLSKWLEEIIDLPGVSMEHLQPLLLEPSHAATQPLAVRVAKAYATNSQFDDETRARWLHNGSTILAGAGDTEGALDMIEKAVEISRGLSANGSLEHLLSLASNLDGLSNRLSEAGQPARAVAASRDAVTILRKAVAANLDSDENALQLANVLNNYSAHLNSIGQSKKAIDAIAGALQLYRQLATSGKRDVAPELANGLHNSAQLLRDLESDSALRATQEAVEILEGLTAENPVRFEPKLAGALVTLSTLRSRQEDITGALDAARRSVQIFERLNTEQPGRYDSDLAIAYESLSFRLSSETDSAVALETIQKAVGIWRRLVAQNGARFHADLARSLDHQTAQMRDKDKAQAMVTNEEAVGLWRQLAIEQPSRFRADLARSLNNLSNLKSANGDKEGSLSASREAHETIRPLAQQDPARFSYELAAILMTLHNRLLDLPNGWPFAIMAISEAVDIFRKLAQKNPARFEAELAQALARYSVLLDKTGDSRRDSVIQEASAIFMRLAPKKPK